MSLDESGESTRSVSFPSLFRSSGGTDEPDVGVARRSGALRSTRPSPSVELSGWTLERLRGQAGGTGNIEKASASLALKAKVSEQRARQLSTLNVVTVWPRKASPAPTASTHQARSPLRGVGICLSSKMRWRSFVWGLSA